MKEADKSHPLGPALAGDYARPTTSPPSVCAGRARLMIRAFTALTITNSCHYNLGEVHSEQMEFTEQYPFFSS